MVSVTTSADSVHLSFLGVDWRCGLRWVGAQILVPASPTSTDKLRYVIIISIIILMIAAHLLVRCFFRECIRVRKHYFPAVNNHLFFLCRNICWLEL